MLTIPMKKIKNSDIANFPEILFFIVNKVIIIKNTVVKTTIFDVKKAVMPRI